ncbi:HupE/UreJ family protein [Agarivorans aestuarii]|uniref:HupE/UreJ family protein n=1 Tax=Agarivorans aestuarii TaxID=1563703 RepID=A0ABU7G6J9_9ALTE|nr:HupE/UreJ family protein [Agarivorans aestuarii]MEE1674933.1 HupE/UreJ family protein [Agarivorans aestuarii]
MTQVVQSWMLAIALSFVTASVFAHDIGVSKAELVEGSSNQYQLRVHAPAMMAARFSSPQLPEGFEFTANPRGSQLGLWKAFEFSGNRPLTADDMLALPWERDGIMLTVYWADGSEARTLFKNEDGLIAVPMSDVKASSGSWVAASKRYFFLGIEHILLGIDHLLFVLGLLWIVRGGLSLLKTITAFTLAHSITLGLATFGLVSLAPAPVEACIALSIVFLAVEIMRAREGQTGLTHRYPWVVAFAFGLLHGLGFAGALSSIGLAQSEIPIALLFFNIGVEAGQILFVLAVIAAMQAVDTLKVKIPSWVEVIPVYVIGTLATYWLFTRFSVIAVGA